MATRGLILLLSKRWGWVGLGALVLVIGGFIFITAHPTQPVEIDGTLAQNYYTVTNKGAYDHTEIHLNGDSRTFNVDEHKFHPTLTDSSFVANGTVNLWVNSGTTYVVAITLRDEQDADAVKYTTDAYDHPNDAVTSAYTAGGVIGGIGAILLLVGLAWPLLPFGRKKAAGRQPAPVAAGQAPSAYGQPGAYGQQPGYAPPSPMPGAYEQQPGQQPGYGSQPAYGQQPGYDAPGQPASGAGWGQPGQPPAQPGWGQQPPSPYGQPDAGSSQGGQWGQGNWGEPPRR